MKCLVCETEFEAQMIKCTMGGAASYGRCPECGTISTPDDITPMVIMHNDHHESRNHLPNNLMRMRRLDEALVRKPQRVLDYGCGDGELVVTMQAAGIAATGIDQWNLDILDILEQESFDAVTMIEVIEHLKEPRGVLTRVAQLLKPYGVLMIETTFADEIKQLEHNPYVDPTIGHVCMLSRAALSKVLPETLRVETWVNPHVVLVRKVIV